LIHAKPHVAYIIKLEVLRSGLGNSNVEKISEIIIDGKDFGECDPPGNDDTCDFVECRSTISTKEVASTSGMFSVKLKYLGNSPGHCTCDKTTWDCYKTGEKNGEGANKIIAAARITLFPKVHQSGKIK
jgi:hypothetical protein